MTMTEPTALMNPTVTRADIFMMQDVPKMRKETMSDYYYFYFLFFTQNLQVAKTMLVRFMIFTYGLSPDYTRLCSRLPKKTQREKLKKIQRTF